MQVEVKGELATWLALVAAVEQVGAVVSDGGGVVVDEAAVVR